MLYVWMVKRPKVSLQIVSFPSTCKWEYTTPSFDLYILWEPIVQWDRAVINHTLSPPQHKKLGRDTETWMLGQCYMG